MTRCPYCCAMISASQGLVPGQEPHSGDLTMCAFCLSWTVFDEAMELRKPIVAEMQVIRDDPRSVQVMKNMRALCDARRQMTAH